jgi:hypothetical protein
MIKFTSFIVLAPFLYLAQSLSFAQPADVPKAADISLNNIFLYDATSAQRVLGENIEVDSKKDIPSAEFTNADRTELLTVFVHPGGYKDEIAEFQITSLTSKNPKIKRLDSIQSFASGKGIRLGISQLKLEKILGQPLRRSRKNDRFILEYRIEDLPGKPSSFLSYYNMPIYYGLYEFVSNKLVSFQFGFEYP